LTGRVAFLFHPTFPKRIEFVDAQNDRAEVSFYAGGWFTLVAIADGGATVLAYDLRKVPNVPEWFKET